MRDKALTKEVRNFLWKALHSAYKVGTYWEHIKNYEHRARCMECSTMETLEHILTECMYLGQEHAWALAIKIHA